ncbi:gluconate 5-dehydrogenase [Tistlia consotensis]|uniref:Gluconate 5-dehydrogenase n=1 Tax=Tistlia consotensis USBA 355 TaxID=560819 RepID=A0A1Y6C8Z1_9PROT|nr:SDR family oxidoreductase [Tistlia consotensis]SMF52093.1 gluconate 5-dehydrogenase [Tistlia consotensis USBA 355]SNR83358.1 gluconate 5-dehydrogenase [Tistlia consotensis]
MSVELFSLKGRTALVTGSSRGLGLAMARGLAEAGAAVVLNGVDAGRLGAAAEALRAEGHAVREAGFDVADETAVAAAFASLDAAGVEIDVLVNNAGIQVRRPLVEMASEDWRRILETNLTSAFLVGREAAKRMIPRGRGKIVNIGSVIGELVRPTTGPYAAAKGGLKQLTRVMTAEWAQHGIQVNAVGPGYMLTDMNEALLADATFDAWVTGHTPARRWGRADELVGTAVYLASAASDYVSGQMIYVDGGMTSVL